MHKAARDDHRTTTMKKYERSIIRYLFTFVYFVHNVKIIAFNCVELSALKRV